MPQESGVGMVSARNGKQRDYLRVAEVASLFHVSPKTIVRWAEEGKLPYIVTLGGHRRFPREATEALAPTPVAARRRGPL